MVVTATKKTFWISPNLHKDTFFTLVASLDTPTLSRQELCCCELLWVNVALVSIYTAFIWISCFWYISSFSFFIFTRWKQDSAGKRMSHDVTKRPVLQFVSIKRKDCGEWAIPGVSILPKMLKQAQIVPYSYLGVFFKLWSCVQGMVDPGELVSLTLQREFTEEALNSLQASPQERKELHERISKLFSSPGFQVRKNKRQ